MSHGPRLFVEVALDEGGAVTLSPEQAHYLGAVMRREIGDPVVLFNGKDGEWQAELSDITKRRGTAVVTEKIRDQSKGPDIWLLFAPVKRAPIDMIAQKATELGVSRLMPVLTERTIVSRVRTDRLLSNAVEAAEQCERLEVPDVDEPQKLSAVLSRWSDQMGDRKLIFCDEAGDDEAEKWGGDAGRAPDLASTLISESGKIAQYAILIGPEGGFSRAEREALRARDFVLPVTLGPRILRADTAAFAALSIFQATIGDFRRL